MAIENPKAPAKAPKKKAAPKAPAAGAAPATSGALTPVIEALRQISQGELETRIKTEGLSGDAREVAELLNNIVGRLAEGEKRKQVATREIDQALDALIQLVRQGDLTSWNAQTEDHQLGPLLEGFGKVIDTLRTFVREINEAALRLSSSANQVLAASTQHETSSTEQAAAIHETTATMEELKHASAQIAENAGAVARVAEETLGAARSGRGAIGEFIQAMQQIRADGVAVADSINKLSKRVERIGTVVEVIDEIADRSDLLALNAA